MKTLKIGVIATLMIVCGVFTFSTTKVCAGCSYMQLWNNFMTANDAYTSAFGSYHANFYSSPAPCQTNCQQSCAHITNQSEKDACVASCTSSCLTTVESTYNTAQDNLMAAAAETCQASITITCYEIQQRLQACDSKYNSVIEGTEDFQIQQSAYYEWNACQIANSQIPCDY